MFCVEKLEQVAEMVDNIRNAVSGRAMLKCSFDIFLDYFLELLVIINRVNSKPNMQRYCIVFYIYTTYICIQKDVLVVQFPFYNYPIFSK